MDIDQAISYLENIERNYDAWVMAALEETGMTMLGIVVNRIQQEGLPGRQYSTEPLPAFFFQDKELNAGGRALLAKADKKAIRKGIAALGGKLRKNKVDEEPDGISYRMWRQANGLQVDHVDLTFTGRMFQNIGVVNAEKKGDRYVVRLAGLNEEVKKKLIWNAQRFGDFFVLTPDERDILIRTFKNRMQQFIQSAA